jgi:hypothetical protein
MNFQIIWLGGDNVILGAVESAGVDFTRASEAIAMPPKHTLSMNCLM